jgi:tetratricopeptide (TPR) repeat protein
VIEADSRHAQAHQSRAWAWYELKEYDKAIDDFSQAITIDPKYIRSFYGRGLAWEKKGKLHNALTDLKYFAGVDPSFPNAQQAIVRVTAAEKKIEAAAAKIAKVGEVVKLLPAPSAPAENAASAPSNVSVVQGRKLALVIGNDACQNVPKLEKAFVDEGFHVLRGCKEPVRLFSVRR